MKMIPRNDLPTYLQEHYGIEKTLRQLDYWRRNGRGPAYHQIEGGIYYLADDVERWIIASRVDFRESPKEDETSELRC